MGFVLLAVPSCSRRCWLCALCVLLCSSAVALSGALTLGVHRCKFQQNEAFEKELGQSVHAFRVLLAWWLCCVTHARESAVVVPAMFSFGACVARSVRHRRFACCCAGPAINAQGATVTVANSDFDGNQSPKSDGGAVSVAFGTLKMVPLP